MIFYISIFILIIFLIYTNALTDAPNAISTVVGTKVLKFKDAAFISAIFNLIGIIVMSILNFSVADFIFSMIDMSNKIQGLSIIFSAILSTIVFSNVALLFGIPTSETHSLIAGITGALIACKKIDAISIKEWEQIIIGLVISIIGTYIVTKMINIVSRKYINNSISDNIKRKLQILSSAGVSFMHGAQDGQKFIGVIIAYQMLIRNEAIVQSVSPENYFWVIVLVSVVMFVGVATGGRKIVETLGNDITELNYDDALVSDFSSILILLISSLNGIPISTSHVKTVSIFGAVDKDKKVNFGKVSDIFKAWIYTFPICILIAYVCMKGLMFIM